MATIYKYEVRFKLTNPNTGEVSETSRLEYAYSVQDAIIQGLMNVAPLAGSAKVDLLHVGPPEEEIRAVEQIAERVAAGIDQILGGRKKA